MKKIQKSYAKVKSANAKALTAGQSVSLTYRGKRILKKNLTTDATQAAIDDRQRNEDKTETLRLAMIATDEDVIKSGKALLNQINDIISVAKTQNILKIAAKDQAFAIKCFSDYHNTKQKLWHLPALQSEGRELVLLMSTAVKSTTEIGSSVEWPSVAKGSTIFTTVGINSAASSAATKKSRNNKKSPETMERRSIRHALSKNINKTIPNSAQHTMDLCDATMATHTLKKPSNVLMPNSYVAVSSEQKDEAMKIVSKYLMQQRREAIESQTTSPCKLTHAAMYIFSHLPPQLRFDVADSEPPRQNAFGRGSHSEVASICSQLIGAFHDGAPTESRVKKRRLNTAGIRNEGSNFVPMNIE